MSERKELDVLLRNDFYSYVQRVFYELGNDKFIPNWHLEVLCDALERARRGEIKRLIINVPPRSLKSIVVNVAYSTWLLGHNPKEHIVSASYSAELAEKFARDSKIVMESEWYRRIFPRTVISKNRSTPGDFNTTARGGRYTSSVDGTMTGRGGNVIIIDDPIKPSDVSSESAINKVNEWYQHTMLSRLDDPQNGTIILIMQRVHENDLTGYLLENSTDWVHIKIPQIAITDERWPVGDKVFRRAAGRPLNPTRIDAQTLTTSQQELGTYVWSAQYQQEPCPLEGGVVKESWLHYYTKEQAENIDPIKYCRIFLSWDTANKACATNAYSACCVVLMTRENNAFKYYLLEVVRGKWEMPELIRQVTTLYYKWRYKKGGGGLVKLLIEDKASGTQLIQMLSAQRDCNGYGFDVEPIKPDADKTSRLMGVSAYIENGTLQFPQEEPDWWAEFKKELLSFPGSRYKDQVDALTQCINYALQQ